MDMWKSIPSSLQGICEATHMKKSKALPVFSTINCYCKSIKKEWRKTWRIFISQRKHFYPSHPNLSMQCDDRGVKNLRELMVDELLGQLQIHEQWIQKNTTSTGLEHPLESKLTSGETISRHGHFDHACSSRGRD